MKNIKNYDSFINENINEGKFQNIIAGISASLLSVLPNLSNANINKIPPEEKKEIKMELISKTNDIQHLFYEIKPNIKNRKEEIIFYKINDLYNIINNDKIDNELKYDELKSFTVYMKKILNDYKLSNNNTRLLNTINIDDYPDVSVNRLITDYNTIYHIISDIKLNQEGDIKPNQEGDIIVILILLGLVIIPIGGLVIMYKYNIW